MSFFLIMRNYLMNCWHLAFICLLHPFNQYICSFISWDKCKIKVLFFLLLFTFTQNYLTFLRQRPRAKIQLPERGEAILSQLILVNYRHSSIFSTNWAPKMCELNASPPSFGSLILAQKNRMWDVIAEQLLTLSIHSNSSLSK